MLKSRVRHGIIIGVASLLVISSFGVILVPGSASALCLARLNVTTFPSTYSDTVSWGCTAAGLQTNLRGLPKQSWDMNVFNVTGPKSLNVTVTGTGFIGNFFDLWVTTDKSLSTGWFKLGTTPTVHTDSHLVAPTYNILWTGTGNTQSHKSFIVNVATGTSLFLRVDGRLYGMMTGKLDKPCGGISSLNLLTFGCSATGISVAASWNFGTLTIKFQ